MQAWAAMFVCLLAGCGSVGAKPSADSATLDASSICDPTGTFEMPVPLAGFNTTTAQESAPRLTPDERELYLAMEPSGESTYNLYRAQRDTTNQAFSTPAVLADVNSTADDFNGSSRVRVMGDC